MGLSTNFNEKPEQVVYNFESKIIYMKFSDGRLDKSIPFSILSEEDVSIYLAPQLDLIETAVVDNKTDGLIHESSTFDKISFGEDLVKKEIIDEQPK